MFWTLVCLVSRGRSLTEADRNFLFFIAKKLAKSGENRLKIKEDGLEGYVDTDYQLSLLGFYSGIKFTAKVETLAQANPINVDFLISEDELKNEDGHPEDYMWLENSYKGVEKAWLN